MLVDLDQLRHRIPFWWWLTYDALVGFVIAVGVTPWSAAMWVGYSVLGIAVVIDAVEFLVKRPATRARLDAASGNVAGRATGSTPDPDRRDAPRHGITATDVQRPSKGSSIA